MTAYVFPGYPTFLQRAASQLGRPETAFSAGRVAALAALANLCSQATFANAPQAAEILARAATFRDHLHTAALAADLMLAEVEAGCLPDATPIESATPPAIVPGTTPASVAKTSRGPR